MSKQIRVTFTFTDHVDIELLAVADMSDSRITDIARERLAGNYDGAQVGGAYLLLGDAGVDMEIVGGDGDAERMKPCHKCGAELVECWNLAPIGASADNKHRIYADGVYLCDECHDVWATDYGIQPLDGE